jgi:hypothetical protein
VTDGKKLLLFFTFDYLSVKTCFEQKTNFKIFGVKPVISIYSIYDVSKKSAKSEMVTGRLVDSCKKPLIKPIVGQVFFPKWPV